MSQVVGLDMVTGMGFIGLEPGRLYKIGQSPKLKDQTASGNPLLLNSAEAPLTALSLYGWSKQDGTPSLKNPVPIVSAGSVMVESKNLFNYKNLSSSVTSVGATIVANSDGSFTISGEGQLTGVFAEFYDDYELVNKLKVGAILLSPLATTKPYFYVQFKDESNISLITLYNNGDGRFSEEITEDILAQTKYIRYGFYGNVDGVIVPGTIAPMLYQDGDGTYEPYFAPYADPDEGEINVTVQGGNLFDESLLDDENNFDKSLVSSGYWIIKFPVPPGDITVSVGKISNASDTYFAVSNEYGGGNVPRQWFIHSVATNGRKSITYPKGQHDKYIYLYLGVSMERVQRVLSECEYIQVEIGDTATQYEPYKTPQPLTVSTPGGLPGIPVSPGGNYTDESGQAWICDEVDFKRGKYVQRVWRKTFDGSEDEAWGTYDSINLEGFYCADALPEFMKTRASLCNQLIPYDSISSDNAIRLGANNKYIYCTRSSFYDPSLEDYGLANWKAHLAAHPLEVMTYLETPIETDLSDEEIAAYKSLHTYSPATTVSNDADVQMGVGYKK